MFKLKYPDGAIFKKIMQGSLKPIEEVPIKVSDTLLVRALSPDKNILVEVTIPQTAFEEFEVEGEQSLTADRDEFLRSIRRATKRDAVILEYIPEERQIKLTLLNTRTGTERSYSIRVMDIAREPVPSLSLELPVSFKIPTEDLKKLIRDVKLVGDIFEIVYNEGRIEVTAESEGKKFHQVMELDKPLISLNSSESMVSSRYDADLLKSVSAAFDIADTATVEFGPDLPMKITILAEDGTQVTYWIASRA